MQPALPLIPLSPGRASLLERLVGFRPLGLEPLCRHVVWPPDEILSRYRCRRHVAERIRKLNPSGVVEGFFPRGWNRKQHIAWRQAEKAA